VAKRRSSTLTAPPPAPHPQAAATATPRLAGRYTVPGAIEGRGRQAARPTRPLPDSARWRRRRPKPGRVVGVQASTAAGAQTVPASAPLHRGPPVVEDPPQVEHHLPALLQRRFERRSYGRGCGGEAVRPRADEGRPGDPARPGELRSRATAAALSAPIGCPSRRDSPPKTSHRGRAWPGGDQAVHLCTRPSRLVIVPSTSPKAKTGKTTWARREDR